MIYEQHGAIASGKPSEMELIWHPHSQQKSKVYMQTMVTRGVESGSDRGLQRAAPEGSLPEGPR